MKKVIYHGPDFNGHPLYRPFPEHVDKATDGFDLATLQRIELLIPHALAQGGGRVLAVGMTLAYPAEIDTSTIDNRVITDFTSHFCRYLREQRGLSVDFLQVRERAPRTGRLHHHCIVLIGGGWWQFTDYRTVRAIWRMILERWFGWAGTAAEVPVQIVDN